MSDPITVEKFAIGQSVKRLEDPRLVQGLGRYSDDVNLPRQAYAVLARSPHAHARVRGIDAGAALKAPGVVAVLTAADLAADGVGNLPTDRARKRRDGTAAFPTPRPALVRDRVRHVGDPVALVIAETHAQAVDAADLLDIDYEPLPAVGPTADALRPGAPAVWDEVPDNIAFVAEAGQRRAGDPRARRRRPCGARRLRRHPRGRRPAGAARRRRRVRSPQRPLHAPHRHPGPARHPHARRRRS